MNPRAVWTIAAKDLRRRRRDPLGVLAMLAVPVALLLVFRLAFGGVDSGRIPPARLLLVDQDGSLLSRFVTGAFQQDRLAEMVEAVAADSAEAIAALRRNRASAALFLPRGFGRDYLEGRTSTLRLLKNPSQRILPTIVEEITAALADGGSGLRDLLGGPLGRVLGATDTLRASPADVEVAGIAVEMRRLADRAGTYLLPPAVSVRREETAAAPEGPGFLFLFFPGLVGMALLYLSQTIALDFSEERQEGTLRRALSTGRGAGELFAGKTLAGMLVILPLLLILFLLGRLLLGFPLPRAAGAWGLSGAAAFAVLAALSLLALLPRNPNQANVISNLVILPVAFLGGCYFPLEALSDRLYAVASRLPMGWIVERIKDVVLGRVAEPREPWLAAATCLACGGLFLLAAARLAARRFREA